MLEYINKDITTVEAGIIVHGVNCQNAMGSGVALAIKTKWPEIYTAYMRMPGGPRMLGQAHMINVSSDGSLWVCNAYTQEHYGRNPKARYADPQAIHEALQKVIWGAGSLDVYLPRIGSGLGGLNWNLDVEPILTQLASDVPNTNIYVCDI